MTIERRFDISFAAALALREKQIQQNYRPIIAVHKWFARRPGTLFRCLLLSEFGDGSVPERFFKSNSLANLAICDPFMGGGTPLLEANRLGCSVLGIDINPMAAHIVQEEIEEIDLDRYAEAASALRMELEARIGHLYRTTCTRCSAPAPVKYFLWVKTQPCAGCSTNIDLFPGPVVAKPVRHPRTVLVCYGCGALNEVENPKRVGSCDACGEALSTDAVARRGEATCRECSQVNSYPRPDLGPPTHRLFALEYHCPNCKPTHRGRFFKKPDRRDLDRSQPAAEALAESSSRFVPDEHIAAGDETNRLHRWGYTQYKQLFSERQLLALATSASLVAAVSDERIRRALATNFSDLLRYQNMLCRYDTMALKSLDIFSIHGFPVGLVQCESNPLGIPRGKASQIGSGGWSNMIAKYTKAKRYCEAPFETAQAEGSKRRVFTSGEKIGMQGIGDHGEERKVELLCADARTVTIAPNSLDAVFTDPPYFGNVQYGELMEFCHVWLRRLVDSPHMERKSARHKDELTGNSTEGRGLVEFTDGLGHVFRNMARGLKPGRPLAFTFHHNKIDAYCSTGVAILDSGLNCSGSIPCPAEMAGSIHIHGTASSVVDTVFVCRDAGNVPAKWLASSEEEACAIVADDLAKLECAGLRVSEGDARCVAFGHLTRLVVWRLHDRWDTTEKTTEKLRRFRAALEEFGDAEAIAKRAMAEASERQRPGYLFERSRDGYMGTADVTTF